MVERKKKTKAEKRHLKAIKERERAKDLAEESKERLLSRVVEEQSREGRKVLIDESSPVKMSEVIMDFAKPLLKHAKTFEQQRKALDMSIIIWNVSMLPEEEQIKNALKIGMDLWGEPEEANVDQYEVLAYMLARRHALFSGIPRIIITYEVVAQPQGCHLNVVHHQLNDRSKKAGSDTGRKGA